MKPTGSADEQAKRSQSAKETQSSHEAGEVVVDSVDKPSFDESSIDGIIEIQNENEEAEQPQSPHCMAVEPGIDGIPENGIAEVQVKPSYATAEHPIAEVGDENDNNSVSANDKRIGLKTNDAMDSADQLSFEKRKNTHLLHLLFKLRSSDSINTRQNIEQPSNQSNAQLERTYNKALGDFTSACEKLENQTDHCRKHSTDLRNRLREKEDKAENSTKTLEKYREDIAKQSSFNSSKPFDMELFEELTLRSQLLDDDVEKERLKNCTLKVEINQLEQKIKKKNELAGGISHIEFHHLANEISKSDVKLKHCDVELERSASSKRQLLSTESKLQEEIQNYRERNSIAEQKFRDLDGEIEKKRDNLSRLESVTKAVKKKIGYDAADVGAYLKTRVINDDFVSSEGEIERLHKKLNELTELYSALLNQT